MWIGSCRSYFPKRTSRFSEVWSSRCCTPINRFGFHKHSAYVQATCQPCDTLLNKDRRWFAGPSKRVVSLCRFGSCLCDAELPHHPVNIVGFKVLHQFAILDTTDYDALHRYLLSGGLNSHEFSLMGSSGSPVGHDFISFGLLINGERHVREGATMRLGRKVISLTSGSCNRLRAEE